MQELYLALGVTLTILSITAVKSAKLRAAIYTLPLPITIVLLGTDHTINATHPFSLLIVILFLTTAWLLCTKLRLNIFLTIVLAVVVYAVAGLINQVIVELPFAPVYVAMVLGWSVWIVLQPLRTTKAAVSSSRPLRPIDYVVRGLIVLVATYMIVGLREFILGAAVTFPFNGIFTAYIMRDSLPYLISEVSRNFIGIINFFGVIYLLQGHVSTFLAFIVGWIVCVTTIFCVSRYIPRRRLI